MPKIIKQCYRDKTEQGSRHLFRFFMLILLAESKTMSVDQNDIDAATFENNKPFFENDADAIMAYIERLSPLEISDILGISLQLAVKAHTLAYDFPHKPRGYEALYGYTGEAFKALQAETLGKEATKQAFDRLWMVSSVYGLLKSSDIIKPYRCEFNKPIIERGKTPAQFYKSKNTIELARHIKSNKITDVINLLPGDADKCIDWKIIRAFAKVHKIVFQTITPEGRLKTPIAKRLKELRGTMARTILLQNIKSFKELTVVESPEFIYSPTDSKPLLPVFITNP